MKKSLLFLLFSFNSLYCGQGTIVIKNATSNYNIDFRIWANDTSISSCLPELSGVSAHPIPPGNGIDMFSFNDTNNAVSYWCIRTSNTQPVVCQNTGLVPVIYEETTKWTGASLIISDQNGTNIDIIPIGISSCGQQFVFQNQGASGVYVEWLYIGNIPHIMIN